MTRTSVSASASGPPSVRGTVILKKPAAASASASDSGSRRSASISSAQARICGPIARCVELAEQAAWRQADLLLATDGEFGATPELAERFGRLKTERGLRVQGVLIGDRETIGLLELADEILWVRDWRRFGGSEAASPVHSKSLTAMYFPGALRNAETRQGTVSGEAAATAVRVGQPQAKPPLTP